MLSSIGSRILRSLCLAAILVDTALVTWVIYAGIADHVALVSVRYFLFTETFPARDHFESSPEDLHASFKRDSEDAIRGWVEESAEQIPYLNEMLALEGSATERVQAMVPIFSRNGHLVDCGNFHDLADTLQRIGTDDGYGCCSDHTEAFLALTSLMGIAAREMIHSNHVFAEFYDPELGHWVWVDPQFALMARNEKGDYLSLMELRDRYLAHAPIQFEFIGNSYHVLKDKDPKRQRFYDEVSDFAIYSATWGNNVFEQDAFDRRFDFLPIYARQLLGLVTGRLPGYRTLVDEHSPLPEKIRSRREMLSYVAILILALNLTIPVQWLAWRRKRARRRRT